MIFAKIVDCCFSFILDLHAILVAYVCNKITSYFHGNRSAWIDSVELFRTNADGVHEIGIALWY